MNLQTLSIYVTKPAVSDLGSRVVKYVYSVPGPTSTLGV
jgi:hypothetical protein